MSEKAIKDNPSLQEAWRQQQLELDPTDNIALETTEGVDIELNGSALTQPSA